MKIYPTILSDTKVFLYPGDNIKIMISSELIPKDKRSLTITSDAWAVLKYCDGSNDLATILEKLQIDFEITENELLTFFKKMEQINLIKYNSIETSRDYLICGDGKTYFPSHVSFRITEHCNLNCSYCYMGGSIERLKASSYHMIETILKKLKDNNVQTIELTGGEPMVHHDIFKIINYAVNNFNLITILTNGVYFQEKIINFLSNFKKKVFIQISVDGFNEEVSTRIRRVKNTSIKTINTIKKIIEFNIPFRVAIVLTPANVFDLENMILSLKNIGVRRISLSFAEELGNAQRIDSNKETLFQQIAQEYGEYISRIADKFPEIVNVELKDIRDDIVKNTRNCGAGSRSVAINHLGDVYPCVMLNDKIAKMGNLFKDDYYNIFNKSLTSKIFRDFDLKSQEDSSCHGCEYNNYCSSCLTKVFIANRNRHLNSSGLCTVAKEYKLEEITNF